jgi:hypothetical protein
MIEHAAVERHGMGTPFPITCCLLTQCHAACLAMGVVC